LKTNRSLDFGIDDIYYNVVGIDLSMTSPAICSHPLWLDFKYETCIFNFYTTQKSKAGVYEKNIIGTLAPLFNDSEKRFDDLSSWAMSKILPQSVILLEDYSYGSRGAGFHIGENGGVLKHKFYKNHPRIKYSAISPGTLKKFATGKGNAKKDQIYESFLEQTGIKLGILLGTEGLKKTNPTDDLIDAYYLCKYLHQNIIKPNEKSS
jgi:Holliday junction resolvasome RuvABC endonuclease subunit